MTAREQKIKAELLACLAFIDEEGDRGENSDGALDARSCIHRILELLGVDETESRQRPLF